MNPLVILLTILGTFSSPVPLPSQQEKAAIINISSSVEEGYCPSGFSIFSAFQKVIESEKYKCYGRPSGRWKEYYCPNSSMANGPGTCNGSYVQQEFCNNGKTVNLYHSKTECTCGCVDKNFHGKKLNILDLSGCGCDDDLDEIIGVDF